MSNWIRRSLAACVILVLTLLLPAGCASISVDEQPTSYRPLSAGQIKHFIIDKNLILLEIKTVRNFTIILFEIGTAMGSYALTSDEEGRISICGVGISNNTSVSTGTSSSNGPEGLISYSDIVINDKKLLEQAYLIKATLSDDTEINEFVNNQKGHIIPHPGGSLELSRVVIYDKDEKVLFDETYQ